MAADMTAVRAVVQWGAMLGCDAAIEGRPGCGIRPCTEGRPSIASLASAPPGRMHGLTQPPYNPPTPACYPCTQSLPRKVGPSYFSDRIPTVTRPQSEELWGALSALGGFDAQGYLLPVDLNLVFTTLPWLADGLIRDAVFQEVQIAVGNHENMGESAFLMLFVSRGMPGAGGG